MYLLEQELKAIKQALKHMAGRHNQQNHGNRFGIATGGGAPTLVHQGGGAAGHNLIRDSNGVALAVRLRSGKIGKKRPAAGGNGAPAEPVVSKDESGFPSEKDFGGAKLEGFHGGINSVYSTTINGSKYFVKKADSGGSEMNEVVAAQAAKAMGLGEYTVGSTVLKRGGEDYLIAPWEANMKTFIDEPYAANEAVGKLSSKEFTKLHAYEYLMDDADRHGGNFMVDPSTGKIKIIDLGFALNKPADAWYGRPFNPENSKLDKKYSAAKGFLNVRSTQLDKKSLEEMATKADAIPALMKAAHMPQNMIDRVITRIQNLHDVAARKDYASISNLQNLGF